MANDDDDDSLPPLGEDTQKFLDEAKKGKPRAFLLICKGPKVRYLKVKKKPIKKGEITEAKKLGYKGDVYIGVITGTGMALVFNLAVADGYDSEPCKDKVLKDFLEEHADFKAKPTFAIVATSPAIPFDEEDLKHPLIARFMAMAERITQVLDKSPQLESEIATLTNGIRLLLQDEDYQAAGPQIDALDAKLTSWLSGTPETPPEASPAAGANQADEALRIKLQEALNKLVPQLKQAVANFPDRKVELLSPVAAIKKQLDAGLLQEARQGLLQVGQSLKSLLSAGSSAAQAASSSPAPAGAAPSSVSDEATLYANLLREVEPLFNDVVARAAGDTSGFRAVMAYAIENAAAGVFANSIRALEKLLPKLKQALESASPSKDMGIQEGIVAKRTFMLTRMREILADLRPLLKELCDAIEEDEIDADPLEIQMAFEQALTKLLEDAQGELDRSINSGDTQSLQGMTDRITSSPTVKHLVENPFIDGQEFESRIREAFLEIEKNLSTAS